MTMGFLEWAALVVGAGLMFSGARAIRLREAHVPERYEGGRAVRLGWLWMVMGIVFILSVILDIAPLKVIFRLFLEASS